MPSRPHLESPPPLPPRLSWNKALVLHPATPWMVLAVALLISLALWQSTVSANERLAQERFQRYITDASQRITSRMQELEQILRGAVGLLQSSESVSRAEWRDFFQTLNLKEHYPGILALGFTIMLPAGDKTAHEQQVRKDGFPQYTITPPGQRPEYSSIVYIEPFQGPNLSAFGYDMFAEPTRRAAMELARDNNSAALSGKVVLIQEKNLTPQAGTIMYLPVYRRGHALETTAQRRQALLGFVYGPFRMKELMADILGQWGHDVDFEIFDNRIPDPNSLLYSTRSEEAPSEGLRQQLVTLNLPRRDWTLRFHSTPAFEAELRGTGPLATLAAGTTISLLLFLMLRGLAREVRQQHQAQADLVREQRRLEGIARLRDAYIRGHDRKAIFELVLNEILALSDSPFGYITELQWDEDDRPTQKFLALSDISWDAASREMYAGVATGKFQFRNLEGLYAAAIASGSAVIANDPAHHPASNGKLPPGHPPLRTFLGLPIFRDGRIVGSVGLANRRGGYDASLADYLQPVVDSCAQIIDALRDKQALEESESQLRQLCNSLPQLIWSATPRGSCDFLSRQWEEFSGVPSAQQLGDAWLELVHGEDRERFVAAWAHCIHSGDDLRIDCRIRRRDGTYRWFDSRAVALKDRDGRVLRWIGSNTDVQSEREMTEELLEARRIIAQGQVLGRFASWAADLKRGRCFVPDFSPIVNRPPGEYSWEELLQQAHPEELPSLKQAWQAAAAGEAPFNVKARLLVDGEVRWLHLTAEFERNADGKAERAVGVAQDITREVETEEEIRQLNEGLERRVRERTAELAAANHELEGFAYAVSHDLRAPLRAITGFSQALLEDCGEQLNGEAREYLDEIIHGGRHLGELINGLLTLSRCTRGELSREAVDISALSQGIAGEIRKAHPEARFDLEIEPGIQVQGDPAMLEVVMRNLLENAWKYSAKANSPRLQVHAAPAAPGHAAWCVTDNGAGFDMSYANKLFKPFQRLHRQSEFPGTGIGLATVQRIVHRHGGDISASAGVNQGATFQVTLPC